MPIVIIIYKIINASMNIHNTVQFQPLMTGFNKLRAFVDNHSFL